MFRFKSSYSKSLDELVLSFQELSKDSNKLKAYSLIKYFIKFWSPNPFLWFNYVNDNIMTEERITFAKILTEIGTPWLFIRK